MDIPNAGRLLVTDLDGTLLDSDVQYSASVDAIAMFLRTQNASAGQIAAFEGALDRHSKALFVSLGVWGGRWPTAAGLAAGEVFGGDNHALLDGVFSKAAIFRDVPCEPIVPMIGAVARLNYENVRVAVLTRGDHGVQVGKIARLARLGIRPDAVYVVPSKNVGVFGRICSDFEIDPSRAVAVGDSASQDVLPAVGAGFERGVFINNETWAPLDDATTEDLTECDVVSGHVEAAESVLGAFGFK